MKRFNKHAALNKLSNKNNTKTKKRTIIISVIVLVIGILYFSFARFESTASFSLISGTANIQNISLIDKINELKTNGSTELEYDETADNNLRYVGANPNNYVEFNGEKWRVIGVMNNIEKEDGTTKSLVKIRRAESLGSYSWDTTDSSVNNGWGINQWGESGTYEGSDLMRELNTDYLGNITVGTDGKWYNGANNSKTANMPTSTFSTGTQSMIETVKWNLGSPSYNDGTYDSNYTSNIMPSVSYIRERTTTIEKTCTSPDYCNDTVTRTANWTGKVGLIYPSDYGYATSGGSTTNRSICLNTSMYRWNNSDVNDCKNNDWLFTSSHQWTMSPRADSSTSYGAFILGNNGFLSNYGGSDGAYEVFPVVFLQSDIIITGGNGSSEKPYKLHKPTISETIKSLKTNGSTELEYDGTVDNNLRYIGAAPNNYVEFNGELWRIIGVMNNIEKEDGTTESLVKIRRAESLGNYSWDTSEPSINNGYGINQWGATDTYEGADLMRELNNDYLGNITVGTDGKWYYGKNNSKTANMPTSTLSTSAQSMIQTVKWNLGSPSNDNGTYDSSYTTNFTPSLSYTRERTNTNGKVCPSGTYCNDTVNRTSAWTGKVGLIYPSDYGYATSGGTTANREVCLNKEMYYWDASEVSDCKNNDWLLPPSYYQSTLSPFAYSETADSVFFIASDGYVSNGYALNTLLIFPVVFLQSDITIIGGNGSSASPYLIR